MCGEADMGCNWHAGSRLPAADRAREHLHLHQNADGDGHRRVPQQQLPCRHCTALHCGECSRPGSHLEDNPACQGGRQCKQCVYCSQLLCKSTRQGLSCLNAANIWETDEWELVTDSLSPMWVDTDLLLEAHSTEMISGRQWVRQTLHACRAPLQGIPSPAILATAPAPPPTSWPMAAVHPVSFPFVSFVLACPSETAASSAGYRTPAVGSCCVPCLAAAGLSWSSRWLQHGFVAH